MIAIDRLSKNFGTKSALDNVSFKAKKGDVIGFLGPNGAGKTTTMRLLLGYLAPSSGVVAIDGETPLSDRMTILSQAGYLAENNPLYTDMKVNEYLAFVANVKKDTDYERMKHTVKLEDVWDNKIETLSRGFRQRVGLAAALLGEPRLLILDEPTSGLDPIEQEHIKNLIKKLSKDKTIIFSTHILSEVESIASRLIIINKGKVVFDGKKPSGKGSVEKLFKKVVK